MTAKPMLRDYQIGDLTFYNLPGNEKCLNLSDPSTGKTPSVCVQIEKRILEDHCGTAWSMPKSLLKKNYDEILRFTNLTANDVVIIDGTKSQREAQMKKPAVAYLMGFTRYAEDWQQLQHYNPYVRNHICDEMHLGFKGVESKRTHGFWQSMRNMDYFIGMTGTLIDGRLDTAYPAIHAIEPRYYFNHHDFMLQHAVMDFYGTITGWKNHQKLAAIFGRHGIRHTFEEVYGPEAKVIVAERVDMSPAQREAYDEFEEKGIIELEEEWLEAKQGGVHLMRCLQIMACPEIFEGLLPEGTVTGKDEALKLHLENHIRTGERLAIFATLVPEIERIAKLVKSCGLRVGIMHGGVPIKARTQMEEDFRDGKIDVMVASPDTAGVGFNWGFLNHIIFASVDYKDSAFVQAYRRGIRGKRDTPLLITVLEYLNSIDQMKFAMLMRKSREANKIDPSYQVINLFAPGAAEEEANAEIEAIWDAALNRQAAA